MSTARILKWISGILEAVLAIPVLGGLIVLGNGYAPLGVMLILHIITMAVSSQAGVKKHGSILGDHHLLPRLDSRPGLDPPRSHRHRPDPGRSQK